MFDALLRRQAEIARHSENRARLAQAFGKFQTTGQGFMEFGERVDFGLTFIEQPYATYCCQLDIDDLADLMDVDPGETPPLPLVTGIVTNWDQDDRDFYVGAWMAVNVYFPPSTPAVDIALLPVIQHHFTFTGIAIKDIPTDDMRD